MVVTNNGNPFGANDWSRLKRIAEGNPDETKIGAFGVGFYSVFSDCEEPFVSSGKEAMAFYWKGNSLFTRRLQLSDAQANADTVFVLDYRNTTSPIPSLLPLCQFLASSLTFVGLSNIELWLDDLKLLDLTKLTGPGHNVLISKSLETKTTEGLMKVESVVHETAQLEAKWLNIIGWKPRLPTSAASANSGSNAKGQSLRSFFSKFASNSSNAVAERAAKEERENQEAILEDLMGRGKATVFLHVNTATITTSINKTFEQELERATKKPAPKRTKLAILTASYDETAATQTSGSALSKVTDVFASVLPSKSGRIFIGFPTHQTTGLSAHISAQSVIPTVERESIDLNARWVRTWNMEMLRATGVICRIAWSSEIGAVRDKLNKTLAKSGSSKIRPEDIDQVIPEAIHILNQFTFKESTPSSQVGSLIEEAFWTCNKSATIEILSSRGILPSQNVRIGVDDLSFVEGIPVVPPALFDQASGFVKKLVDYGIITEITTADIKKELEAQALDEKQVVEFLQWLGRKSRLQDIDSAVVSSLLDIAVGNDTESRKILVLGQIKHFINPSKIPATLPIPFDTIPFKFTKSIERSNLEGLGWSDLQLTPWVKFLVENTGGRGGLSSDHDIEKSAEFAAQVLPVISKQWDGLSQSSKATIVNLFSTRTVIPTKLGMRKPGDAYFQSVKLFDDLPVVSLQSVKEKFLASLGLRKTVELNLVFERLLNSGEKSASTPAWSHADLIRYLTSVRNDIPREDVKRLQNTPLCPAENEAPSLLYRLSNLFEPKDELRALGLKTLQWPGNYRSGSDEGRFLRSLGLREYPTATELITITAMATTDSKFLLRDKALRYLVDFYVQHGYSSSEIGSSVISFLPLEGNENATSVPSRCYRDERAAFMGFPILRKDLHPHATKLCVARDPPIEECAIWLTRNPPQTNRDARQVFEYFATRFQDLKGRAMDTLSDASFVPVPSNSPKSSEKARNVRHLPPTLCFLGSSGKYSDIFDYVDFGHTANSFLFLCGSKPEPTTLELAAMIVREPARVFSIFDSTERYQELLSSLAASWSTLKREKNLVKEMRASPFLLASKEFSSSPRNDRDQTDLLEADPDEDEETSVKTWQLAPASHITIMDDVLNYGLFKDSILTAPTEEDLETFYAALGAVPLSNMVDERPRIGQQNRDQTSAIILRRLVLERIKLFFHDVPRDQIKHNAAWLERNLTIIAVSSLHVHKTLRGRSVSSTLEQSAIAQSDATLYFTPGSRDLFNVSQALLQILLYRSKTQQAIILTTLLETSLSKLKARGYDVSRILRKKQAEARIAEEQQRRQLEEEEQKAKEAERIRQEKSKNKAEEHRQSLMPGVFPESPNGNLSQRLPSYHDDLRGPPRKTRGFLSSIFGDDRRSIQGPSQGALMPEMTKSLTPQPPTQGPVGHQPKPVATPEQLQQSLFNAIRASRPHSSQSVVSDPMVNEVQESQTFCDPKPGQNISRSGETSSGIQVFLHNSLSDKNRFMGANAQELNAFSSILLAVGEAMHLSRYSLHIFYEEHSATIAFNTNRALFFNYHYFVNLHLADVRQRNTADAIIYWFVVTCHELAHNIVADHSAAHSYYR